MQPSRTFTPGHTPTPPLFAGTVPTDQSTAPAAQSTAPAAQISPGAGDDTGSTGTENPDVSALLHLLMQAYNELHLRVGQLEHAEHLRAILRPRRDLGIDY